MKHSYVLDGSKILRETFGTTVLTPIYDTEDAVCGIVFNNQPFFFMRNLQGDVIGIVNRTGAIVARYSYDAWGACTILTDTSGINIATVNPFRYRGYYFDTETNLYYLQSRYYDPLTGRFINADHAQFATYLAECVLEHNLYAYTSNCVLVFSDHSGCAPGAITVTSAIAQQMGVLATAGVSLLTAVKALVASIYNVLVVVGLMVVALAAVVAICKVVSSIYEQIEKAVKVKDTKYKEYSGKICVYVLTRKAQNVKSIFYVGRTKNITARYSNHKRKKGFCYLYVVYICKDIVQSRIVEQSVLGACLAENFTSIAFGKKPSNTIRGISASKVGFVVEQLKNADTLFETMSLLGCTTESDLLLLLGQ